MLRPRQPLALNPTSSDLHERRAYLFSQAQNWSSVSSESRESLRLNPFRSFARMFLIEAMLHRQDMAQARAEFARLLTLNPDHRDALESWYAEKQGKLSR